MNSLITATRSLIRNISMTAACISLVTVTLIIFGSFIIVAANINSFTEEIYSSLTINAFTTPGEELADDEISRMQDEISSIDGVDSIVYSDKDEQLSELSEQMGEEYDFVSIFGDNNPLSDLFVVTVSDTGVELEKVNEEVGEIDGISYATYGSSPEVNTFLQALRSVKNATGIMTLVFLVIVIFLISTTIKMAITSRKEEISIMRLVGATKFFIRRPFFIEGAVLGLFGGIVATFVTYAIYTYLLSLSITKLLQFNFVPIEDVQQVIYGLPLLGCAIGIVASMIAIRGNLKK